MELILKYWDVVATFISFYTVLIGFVFYLVKTKSR